MKTKTVYVVQYRDKWTAFEWCSSQDLHQSLHGANMQLFQYALDGMPEKDLRIIKRTEKVIE